MVAKKSSLVIGNYRVDGDTGYSVARTNLYPVLEHLYKNGITNPIAKMYLTQNIWCRQHLLVDLRTGIVLYEKCKQWNCPLCLVDRLMRMYYILADLVLNHDFTRVATLTLPDQKNLNIIESYEITARRFRKLVRILRNGVKRGKSGKYLFWPVVSPFHVFALFRADKKGMCHLHLFLNQFVPMKFWNYACVKAGFGKDWNSIGYCDTSDAIRYAIRYTSTREDRRHESYIPKGKRHYSHTGAYVKCKNCGNTALFKSHRCLEKCKNCGSSDWDNACKGYSNGDFVHVQVPYRIMFDDDRNVILKRDRLHNDIDFLLPMYKFWFGIEPDASFLLPDFERLVDDTLVSNW